MMKTACRFCASCMLWATLVGLVTTGAQGSEVFFYQQSSTTQKKAAQPEESGAPSRVTTSQDGRPQGGALVPSSPQAQLPSAEEQLRLRNEQLEQQQDEQSQQESRQPATPPKPPRITRTSDRVALELEGSPIDTLIKFVMDELGLSYVIDPQVTGNVTIFMKGGVPRDQIFEFLEQVLQMNGAAIVQRGDNFYAIVPLSQATRIPGSVLIKPERPAVEKEKSEGEKGEEGAKKEGKEEKKKKSGNQQAGSGSAGEALASNAAARVATPSSAPQPLAPQQQPQQEQQQQPASGARVLTQSAEAAQIEQERGVITYVIPLNFIPASEFIKMAQVYLSDGATVVDFAPSNMLLITDYRRNIQQVLNLVNLLDTEYFELNDIALVPIRYNNAVDIAEDLGKIFAPDDASAGVRIVAIERLNSLLVVTHGANVLQEVKSWIDRLDTPSVSSNIKTFVYQVENNTADNIATVLEQLYQDGFGLPSASNEAQRQQQEQQQQDRQGSQRGQTRPPQRQDAGFVPEQGQRDTTTAGQRGLGRFGGQRTGGSLDSLGPSLRGRPSASEGIRAVVTGSVKIIVNEFNNSLIIQATEADYQYLLLTIRQLDTLPRQVVIEAEIYRVDLNNELSFGVMAFLEGRNQAADAGPATGASFDPDVSIVSRTIIGSARQLRGIINALRARTNVKVVDNPRILTMDGVQATINIGAEIPVSTSSFSDPLQSGNTGFINQIQFRPTGTTLLIVPRISASGIVTLELSLEVSQSSTAGTDTTNLTPTINRSLVETTLICRDGQTVALGGIISESQTFNRRRVPLLGDIPVFGALFGETRKDHFRSELIFMITPKVIQNLPTAAEMTLEFQRALINAHDYIEKKQKDRNELIQKRREESLRKNDN